MHFPLPVLQINRLRQVKWLLRERAFKPKSVGSK